MAKQIYNVCEKLWKTLELPEKSKAVLLNRQQIDNKLRKTIAKLQELSFSILLKSSRGVELTQKRKKVAHHFIGHIY